MPGRPPRTGPHIRTSTTPGDHMRIIAQLAALAEQDWRRHGACRDHPAEDWFPEPARSRADRERVEARTEQAKKVCRGCPVMRDCRAHAFAAREPYGVWGGLTSRQRWNILRGVA